MELCNIKIEGESGGFNMFKSIKTKMVVIISILVLFLIASSSYLAFNTTRYILEDTLKKTARNSANNNSVIFGEKLFASVNTIKNLDITYFLDRESFIENTNMEVLRDLYWVEVKDSFKTIAEQEDYLETIFVADINGKFINTTDERGSINNYNYFKKAINNKELIISSPIQQGDEKVIVIARPIVLKDEARMLLGGTVRLDYLNQIASTMSINGYGHAWIIDKDMNTIVHPNKEYLGNKLIFEDYPSLLEIANEMIAVVDGESIYTINEQEHQISFATIGLTDWSFALTASTSDLLSPLEIIRKGSLFIGFLAVVIGIIIAYFIAVSISKPLIKLTLVAEKVASGDLTSQVNIAKISNKDEIGRLSLSINNMVNSLRTMIEKVAKISEQVTSSSARLTVAGEQVGESAEQVGVSVQNVAIGAEDQATQVENTAGNVTNLIRKIGEINDDSDTMIEAAGRVMTDIKKGNRSLNYSVDNIKTVKTSTGEVAGIINTLGETSTEIDKIVGLINGIAAQTNLLALNAAIEAARAGSAGQGFSVVADEIRQLAEESAGATEQIDVLISKIQQGVNNAIMEMDNNIEAVDNSVKAISDTGEVFSKIERESTNLTQLIDEIVRNTQIMTDDSKQVEKAINEVISLSEQFATNSEEVAASSEEQLAATEEIVNGAKNLKNMSEELSHSVYQFKLQ